MPKSPNMTDRDLEEIAQYLPALKSFSIASAKVTYIPPSICNRVERLRCEACPALVTINAPAATTIDCRLCAALTSLNAPAATWIYCRNCITLTTLDAPAAIEIDCAECDALTTLNALVATEIACAWCPALLTLAAPAATMIQCIYCTALPALNAPVATKIFCNGCTALASLYSPAAIAIDGWQDTVLTDEALLKILTRLRRNIITLYYLKADRDFDKLMKRAGATPGMPLNRWLTDALNFMLPAHFDSKDEENDSKQKIADFFKDLITLADAEGVVKEESLKWFKALKKLDSLQQQMKRVIWLGALLMCIAPGKNLFADPSALSTLMAVGNLENSFLQQKLTHALLSMYDEEASKRQEVWKDGQSAWLKRHQILPHLLFSGAKLKRDSIEALLKTLEPRYYQNKAILTPILEMVSMLSVLPSGQQDKLLQLILKAPTQKKRGEKTKDFDARVAEHRIAQSALVTACRGLLFFAKSDALINVKSEGELLEKHKALLHNNPHR